MDADGVCVATVTLARDADEQRLIQRALTSLTATGLPLVVADGGSPGAVRAFLQKLPRTQLVDPQRPGLIGQVEVSLEAAAATGARYILYTESDKASFFESGLSALLGPGTQRVNGVILAARSAGSFASFPPTQQFAERTINGLTGEFVGIDGDYSYGPFLMDARLTRDVRDLPAELGWGWRHTLFAIAHRRGLRISHVVADHPCPEEQRREDDRERLHRLKQLAQNVNGLIAGMARPLT